MPTNKQTNNKTKTWPQPKYKPARPTGITQTRIARPTGITQHKQDQHTTRDTITLATKTHNYKKHKTKRNE